MCGPIGHIHALDLNPTQNALLALRIAALKTLPDQGYAAFMGYAPALNRLETYAQVRQALPPETAAFWDGQAWLIRHGVIFGGRWERILQTSARLTGVALGRARHRLFTAPTLAAQSQVWQQNFDPGLWRWSLNQLCRPVLWTRVLGEPGGAFIVDRRATAAKIAARFAAATRHLRFADSEFMNLLFFGRQAPHLQPYHMRAGRLNAMRDNLDRLTLHQGSLDQLPTLFDQGFDAFSLSDFGSYCEGAAYTACWNAITARANKGARFLERRFLTTQPRPPGTNVSLSQTLSKQDAAVIYTIVAGTLNNTA